MSVRKLRPAGNIAHINPAMPSACGITKKRLKLSWITGARARPASSAILFLALAKRSFRPLLGWEPAQPEPDCHVQELRAPPQQAQDGSRACGLRSYFRGGRWRWCIGTHSLALPQTVFRTACGAKLLRLHPACTNPSTSSAFALDVVPQGVPLHL